MTTIPRLRNGELRRQVAEVLAHRAGTDMTPREIATELGGRSSGAVGNALAKLAETGHAEQTSDKPVRFRATPTAAAAATATTTTAPRAPRPPKTASPTPTTTPATPTAPPTVTPPAATVPARPAGPPVPKRVTGPVARPNGQRYHPRRLAGLPDVTVLQKLRVAGVPALLYGPPGTGKTSMVEAAFGDHLYTVQGDGDTTVGDLVGEFTQDPNGRFVFVHGPLVRAMLAGGVLFLDDATLIPPTVLAVVYPAMDGRRQIIVKANGGEIVKAAPGFYTVAGHNPGVHGAVLSDALASRFSFQVQVSTDYDLADQLKIDPRAVRVARNLAAKYANGEIGWAPYVEAGVMPTCCDEALASVAM